MDKYTTMDYYVLCHECNYYYDIVENSPKQNCCLKCFHNELLSTA